ncbi:MAG TPA: fibronectin type III domain-containing protein, partial [Methylomirabilota bacterium]
MKNLPSALSTAALVVLTTLGVPLPHAAVAAPTFVQGTAFSTAPTSATTVTLNRPVARGDLLVGWFAEYNAPGQVQVSDNVNGAWMRAPRAMRFEDETGDIALYYRENSQAAPGGLTITVSAPSSAYLQGTLADYSSVALAGSLDQIVSAFTPDGTVVDTGLTAAVDAGELVFAALVASPGAGSITPGRSQGVPYTPRAQTSTGAAFAEDITSSAAGPQQGTATLSSTTDWYAVCAVFHPYPATPPVPPSTPAGFHAVSTASTRIALSWSPSSGSVAGYTVYRSGFAIGTTGPDTTSFLDTEVTPSATYTYSVDAFDLANDHSARSTSLRVTAPAQSPEFVQGVAVSPPSPQTSYTLTLSEPVLAGDLLVGWFGQYAVAGQVQVSDNVNGPWTRSVSTTWGGSGDIALYYRQNSAPAPSGLRIMVSASAPAYLQEAVADYRHVATVGALDQAMVSQGVGSFASVGPTTPVAGGELVVAAVLTGGQPASAIAGTSQLVPYLLDVQNGSASSDLADILSSAAGPQQGSLSLGSASNWNMVLATFLPATTPTTTTTITTTTTRAPA